VHQLWDVASEICGRRYPLNPLEGFVLGAAFLVHDSGLTAAAYPNGLTGLRQTNYYRDRVAALVRATSKEPPDNISLDSPSSEIAQRALFDTLRAIHAKRAETLLAESTLHPLTGQPYSFFPEPDLYLDCGQIIGQIAASHHWNIDEVDKRFQNPLTPSADFPEWTIDGVKLACILRTADACAIDERRARIMPFLLLNPTGVSRDHWIFQANLKPGKRREEAIVFQSKVSFTRENMSAWWVAYDAAGVADQELRDCDRLLRDRAISGRHLNLRPFAARRVEGAGEPSHLKDEIHVSGWVPVDTAVRIDNPISIVEKLGGWQLYGNDVSAPLREMIQNAADAIRARRILPNGYDGTRAYPGLINIRLEFEWNDKSIGDLALSIEDDGIGMPPDVMTGTLLEFGRSFWNSDDVATRYPGLLSNPSFQPTGRFGIGFFSIFMIADDVKVISRAWSAGLRDAKVLQFHNGVRGRAEFRDHNQHEDGALSSTCSTIVKARIKLTNWLNVLAAHAVHGSSWQMEPSELLTNIERALKVLVFPLDVECSVSLGTAPARRLNRPGVLEVPPAEFAQCFNQVLAFNDKQIIQDDEISLIDEIRDGRGVVHTRGCINTSFADLASGIHIGGFVMFGTSDSIVKGVSAREPATAARSAGTRAASRDQMAAWGKEQLQRMMRTSLPPDRKLAALANLCSFGVDIRSHAVANTDKGIQSIDRAVANFQDDIRVFVFLDIQRQVHHKTFNLAINPPVLVNIGANDGDLKDRQYDLFIWGTWGPNADKYNAIEGSFDAPTNNNSLYAVLIETLKGKGYSIGITLPGQRVMATYIGPEGGRGITYFRDLKPNAEIKGYGLAILAKKKSS
jgi:Histidine kinase-, DNA gyrase B-, and HSP90-like ATPase